MQEAFLLVPPLSPKHLPTPALQAAREESALRAHGAHFTFGLGALANLLPVFFQQQVSSRASIELLRQFRRQGALGLAIGG